MRGGAIRERFPSDAAPSRSNEQQERKRNMTTKKTDEDEPRYGCDNWDRPSVKYRSKGRGAVPRRKVVTTGTVRIRMSDSMADSLTRHLRQGREVHFTGGGEALFRVGVRQGG